MSKITAKTKLCLVIGDPIDHSLSPQIHNAGYEALHIEDQFVYVAANVKIEELKEFIEGVKTMKIRGISCTMPHKQEVMQYIDSIDETAKKIGAVNTIVNNNGMLIGYNTDWLGVVTPLEKRIELKGKKAVVIGAGGATRAIIYGLMKKGTRVTIVNRTEAKAQILADEFDCSASSLSNEVVIREADIIINATPMGMKPHTNKTPINTRLLNAKQIIFDAIYNPLQTKLIREAKKIGAETISGIEMLLYQATAQFELYTGYKAPEEVMKKIVHEN